MAFTSPAALRQFASARPAASFAQHALSQSARRSFQTSRTLRADAVISPKKPIGAFRGTLFGFLLGTVLAGGSLYYYIVDEYKISNELLVEDIYALQSAVQRLEGHVKTLEQDVKPKK